MRVGGALAGRLVTCVDDDAYSFLCIANGAASEQQVVFVETVSPSVTMDSVSHRHTRAHTHTRYIIKHTAD